MSTKKTKLLESAQKNFLKGQYDRAVSEYRQIIQLDPSDIRHRQRLAEILTKVNQKEEAIKEYSFLAKHYVDSVHFLKAIAVYKQIQKLDPSNPDISITLASLNEKQGLIGNATAEYAAAVQIYERNGENFKALNTLESLLALDPGNSAARLRIAEKYFSTGSDDKSINEFVSLLRDLRERSDENGFLLISEKVYNLFGGRAEEILHQFSDDSTDNDLPDDVSHPTRTEEQISTEKTKLADLVPMENTAEISSEIDFFIETEADSTQFEDFEIIEDILPMDEIGGDQIESTDSSVIDEEWEEDIDLTSFHPELSSVGSQNPDPDYIEELDTDLELDELELEIDEDDFGSSAESSILIDTQAQYKDETIDLGKELSIFADEIDFDLIRTDPSDSSFNITANSGFKKGELDNEDTESHYSLGLAYKEMGLFDEAIAEFIVSSRSIERRIDSLILQGVCFKETGNVSKAIEILSATLQDNKISTDECLGLQYELALCYEASGDFQKARLLLTDIIAARPAFSDVATRLRNLKA